MKVLKSILTTILMFLVSLTFYTLLYSALVGLATLTINVFLFSITGKITFNELLSSDNVATTILKLIIVLLSLFINYCAAMGNVHERIVKYLSDKILP